MANLATINNNLLADSGIDPISVVTGAGTATQIAYWSSGSAITGENALVWDATNDRMGVGVVTPAASIHIEGTGSTYSVPSVSNVPGIYIQNTNSASGTANTFLSLRTTGASGGDPILSWDIGGVIGWSAGIDNSDGDKFKIANYWAGLDSNTRLTIDGSGNVGIGTTAPNTLLEANRTIVFSNIDTYGQFVIKTTSGANGKLLNFGVDEANTLSFIQSLYRGIDVMNLVLQRYGGNVGIGVNPSYKLDVNGNVRIGSGTSSLALKITGDDNYIEFDNSGTYIKGGGNLTVSATSNLLLFTGASERMRITSGGSVGIGTSSPLTKLHVSGSISAEYSDSIYLDYSPSAGSYKKGFSGLNQSSGTARGLHIFNYDNDSNQGINFWVGTNASKLQAAVIKNNRQVLFNAYGSGSFTGTVAYNLAVDASGNIIETAGGVVDGSGTANYVPLWSDPNTLTNSIIYQTGGNVGIGTASPTVKLDIEDLTTWAGLDLNGGSGGEIRLQKNGTTYGQIYASDGASTGFVINAQQSGNSMQFQTAGIERMRLTSGGSFGIGTSSPTDTFSVQGNTNLGNSYGNTNSSTYTTRISGYAMRYDASNRYGNYGLLILNSDNGWTASARRFMLTNGLNTNKFAIIRSVDALTDPSFGDGGVISSGTADFVINNTGNIGIGTTSPSYKLQVEGNAAFATNSGGLRIDSYDGNTAVMLPTVANGSVLISDDSGLLTRGTEFLNGGGVIIQSLSGFAPLDVKSNGSNLLYVASSGNVGIGNNSPSYKLDVSGQIRVISNSEYQLDVMSSTSAAGASIRRYSTSAYAYDVYQTSTLHWRTGILGGNYYTIYDQATLTDRFIINSNGNIGVGTTSPNGSATERTIVLANNTATYYITNAANTLRGIFALGNATTEVFIGTQTNHEFHFRTNDTRRMTLKTTGQLQLNAYTSASSFTGTAAGVLAFDSSGNVITQSSTLYPTGSGTTNYVTKWTGSNAIGNGLLYDNGTNVGLGTTAPTTRLMIESSGASFTAPSINDVASLYIRNSNNGSTTAHSIITLRTLESGGGNPFISFDIENIRGYAMGIDNADDDKFKLNYGWNSLSSNTLMTVTYGGNVGIGTTAPTRTLDVRSDVGVLIKGASSSTDATLSLVPASGGRQYDFRNYGSSFGIKDASADVIRMYFNYNGNTGIGTTSPDRTLTVNGLLGINNGTANTQQLVLSIDGTAAYLTSSYIGSSSYVPLVFEVGGSERMRVGTNGNVGIGISSPVSKLEVSSTLNSSAFTGITVSNWAGGGAEQSRAGIAFKAYDWVQSAIWHGRNTTANTNGALVFGTNPNTTDLTVAGVVGRMWIINNGNVGIGSENPSHKLQILGSADSGIRLTDSSGNTRALLNPSGVQHGEFSLYNNNGNTSTYLGGGTSGSNYVVAQGGNFGVGTTAPLAKLSIGSGSLSDSNVPAQMSTGGAGTGAYFGWNKNGSYGFLAGMSNGLDGWTAGVIRMITTDPLYFITNNNGIAMSINSSQQVSIGTTVADTKLSVNGDMNIKAISGGTSYKLYFGSEVTSGPGKCIFLENFYLKIQGHRNEGIRLQGVNASGVVQEFATFYGDANGSYPSQIHLAPSGGNVGIGTTSPSEKLQVAGNVRVGGTAAYNSVLIHNSGATGGGGILTYQNNVAQGFFGALGWYEGNTNTGAVIGTDSASRPIVFYTSSERMRITGGGNVGIGTTSPLKNLDLRGDLILIKTTTANANFGGPVISIGDTTSEVGVCGGIAFAELLSSNPNSVTMGMYYDGKANKFHITGPSDTQSTSGENLANASKHITVQRDNGNVGIGTTSPSQKLEVAGIIRGEAVNVYGSSDPASTSPYLYSPSTGALGFGANGSERMRITSSGNIGISTSSPSVLLHLENSNSSYTSPANNNLPSIYVNNTNSSSSTAHAILALRTLGASGGDPFISFDINGVIGWSMGIDNSDSDKFKIANAWSALDSSTRFSMETGGNATFTGTLTANSFFESSDLRLKTLIEKEIDYSAIANIEARYYKKGDREELGYFAQDFESILPSSISKNDEGFLNLSYNQVHTAKIAALEAKIKQLESQLKNK
jgi:hypothetical protein